VWNPSQLLSCRYVIPIAVGTAAADVRSPAPPEVPAPAPHAPGSRKSSRGGSTQGGSAAGSLSHRDAGGVETGGSEGKPTHEEREQAKRVSRAKEAADEAKQVDYIAKLLDENTRLRHEKQRELENADDRPKKARSRETQAQVQLTEGDQERKKKKPKYKSSSSSISISSIKC